MVLAVLTDLNLAADASLEHICVQLWRFASNLMLLNDISNQVGHFQEPGLRVGTIRLQMCARNSEASTKLVIASSRVRAVSALNINRHKRVNTIFLHV